MKGDTYFEEMFPSAAAKFAPSVLGATAYEEAKKTGRLELAWSIALLSDSLLSRAASWRQSKDCFSSYRFSYQWSVLRQELYDMANKTKNAKSGGTEKAAWVGFLDFRLTDAELEELDAWKPKPQDIWDIVDVAIRDNYRFTLSYNARLEVASCTMIDDNPSRKTGGYALSSADTNGALALKMMTFKHSKLAWDWEILLGRSIPKARRG